MKKLKRSKISKKQTVQDFPIVRYQTDKDHGLSEEQIAERKEHKLVNDTKIRTSNSYFAIICKNICTIFNLIWFVIAVALICVGAVRQLLFLFVVIANTVIAIFQEVKAKHTVERMSMVSAPKIKVVRTGLTMEVKGEDLLLDDIIILENGNQIPADCIIVDGFVEANESLLTGESNSIKKKVGDTLLAGSFLVSGLCYARVDKVGKNNYIQTVAERTKDFKPQTSNLFKDLNSLIKIIVIILVPIGALTFFKESYLLGSDTYNSVVNTSGALTGMIPAGMYLLITVGLSVGVIKLAKKKTLVKNIYSIEMLARANVLCLDKTGTITDGTMNVVDVLPQNDTKLEQIESVMRVLLAKQQTMNATSVALLQHFGKELSTEVKEVIEFSSERKYSATTLLNGKTYFLGAVGFIKCAVTKKQKEEMTAVMEKGLRVIALVEDQNPYNEKYAGKRGKLIAFFALEDHIRKDAIETIAWFKENNVAIKIISGDDALTVSKIAKRVGVEASDKYISLENMSLTEVAQIADKFTVFGRVTPEQKHTIIKTLKTQGNVVAMTGDGVNDTLALKEANCSIAMADGSEVARNISHLVLMESNFSALPAIVKEGRQVVNNVQKSSVLFLMKTLFTLLLCATTLVLVIPYPFAPVQLLPLEMFVIGIPSFILTFQPNSEIIQGNFIAQVLKKSAPCALLMFVNLLIVLMLRNSASTLSPSEYTSLCTLLLTLVGFVNLVWICYPLNWLRGACVAFSAVMLITCFAAFGNFFYVSDASSPVIITLFTLLLCTIILIVGMHYIKEWLDRTSVVVVDGQKVNQTNWQIMKSRFNIKKQNKKAQKSIEATQANDVVESQENDKPENNLPILETAPLETNENSVRKSAAEKRKKKKLASVEIQQTPNTVPKSKITKQKTAEVETKQAPAKKSTVDKRKRQS